MQFRHASAKDAHAPGFYINLQPGECYMGVGLWRPEEILLEQSSCIAKPTLSGIEAFLCDGKNISADIDGNPELPVKLLQWITTSGGRIRSMKIHSVTLQEALMRQSGQQETGS